MSAEAQKPKLDDLRGELRQDFNLPFEFEGEEFKIYVTYKHDSRGTYHNKELAIRIPDICVPPSGYNGLVVEFTKYCHSPQVEVDYNKPEALRFFKKSVKPVLLENLPGYMKRLIDSDASK